MLKATAEIVRHLILEQRGALSGSDNIKARVLQQLVLRYGGIDDAEALLPHVLTNPDPTLLPILQRHGTPDMGRQLFETFVGVDGLRNMAPSDVLQAIGTLGYSEATPTLYLYARDADHHDSRAACLGLLDLDCEAIRGDIRQMLLALEAGSTAFREFLPTLAVKAGEPSLLDLLSRLAERTPVGNVGGIMIGLAAFGPAAIPYFMRYMTERHRQAHDALTGTDYHLAMAFRGLGLKVSDLYHSIRSDFIDGEDRRKIRYRMKCLFSVLPRDAFDRSAEGPRALIRPLEDPAAIYDALFSDPQDGGPSLEQMAAKLPEPVDHYQRLPDLYTIKNGLVAAIHWQHMLDAMHNEFVEP